MRKLIRLLLIIFIPVIATLDVCSQSNSRSRNFNFGWKHSSGSSWLEERSHRIGFIDDDWETIDIPHDATISKNVSQEDSNGANGWFPYIKGAYRKHFAVSSEEKGQRIFIEFEGVYRNAQVWINGFFLGKHLNGYLGFEHDLTDHINYDSDNVIVVKYDNTVKETSRWYTGAGIYRDVWLKILDPLHVDLYGTYVTTPVVSSKQAQIEVSTEVRNQYSQEKMCRLVSKIIDNNDKVIAQATSIVIIKSQDTFSFDQKMWVENPNLWSPNDPQLYTMLTEIYVKDQLLDDYCTIFGIRNITMTPNKGMEINGKKVIAVGGNIHHDLISLGSAAFKAGYEKHLKDLESIGCNSVRLSHNPHSARLLEACDEMGILVFNEGFDKWTHQFYGGEASFADMYKSDVERWIKRDRNHPSVYIWSAGNEVEKQGQIWDPKFETPEAAADYGVATFKKLKAEIKKWDSSRPVTVGLFPTRADVWNGYDSKHQEMFNQSTPAEMAWHSDIVSCNYTEQMFQKDHESYPQMMFINSEANTSLGLDFKGISWSYIDTDYVIGHYYWTAYAYLGESPWPRIGWSRAFFDLGGQLTNIGSMYQSYYDSKPMTHIWIHEERPEMKKLHEEQYGNNQTWNWYPMVKSWNWEVGQKLKVAIFSNCEKVELFMNGKSLGVKIPKDFPDNIVEVETDYAAGILKVVGLNKGKRVTEDILKTAGEAYQIQLSSNKRSLKPDGMDLAYIEAKILDKDGNLLPFANHEVEFEISGEARIAGVSSGDIISHESFTSNKRKAYNGIATLVIRSIQHGQSNKVMIRAKSKILPDAVITLTSTN